jgi:hypothetical protein
MNLRQIKRKYWYPISVDIEIKLRKLRKFTDKLYRRIWPYIFGLFVLIVGFCAFIQMKHDYDLISNYAHIDALSADIYTSWRTDGSPGQDPPEQPIVELKKPNTK